MNNLKKVKMLHNGDVIIMDYHPNIDISIRGKQTVEELVVNLTPADIKRINKAKRKNKTKVLKKLLA